MAQRECERTHVVVIKCCFQKFSSRLFLIVVGELNNEFVTNDVRGELHDDLLIGGVCTTLFIRDPVAFFITIEKI